MVVLLRDSTRSSPAAGRGPLIRRNRLAADRAASSEQFVAQYRQLVAEAIAFVRERGLITLQPVLAARPPRRVPFPDGLYVDGWVDLRTPSRGRLHLRGWDGRVHLSQTASNLMSDCRAIPQPPPRIAVCALWLLSFPLLLPWAPPAAASEPRTSQEVVDRIQRECLRAYTPEMLTAMTSGATDEVPEAVDAAPSTQEDLLDDVLHLDKGPFYPILLEDLLPAFELYVAPGGRFLDLGSGDGRVVFLANVLGADAVGIEYDKQLVKVSRRALRALDELVDAQRAHFVRRDFFKASWSGYDVVFYYDTGSVEQDRVRKKIADELDPGARLLVAHERVPFPGLSLETTFENIHVYRQPEVNVHFPSAKKRCWQEVVDFYDATEGWLNGTCEPSDENFARLADVMARSLVSVGPEGRISGRPMLLERLRQAHGSWREPESDRPGSGRIRIRNFRLRLIDGPVVLVTYEKWEEVRGEVRGRQCTVLFRQRHGLPHGFEWFHVHESRLPPRQ